MLTKRRVALIWAVPQLNMTLPFIGHF